MAKVRRDGSVEGGLNAPRDVEVGADAAHHGCDKGIRGVGQTGEEMVFGLVIEAAGVPAKEATQWTRSV